jgi:hypothetical protein
MIFDKDYHHWLDWTPPVPSVPPDPAPVPQNQQATEATGMADPAGSPVDEEEVSKMAEKL